MPMPYLVAALALVAQAAEPEKDKPQAAPNALAIVSSLETVMEDAIARAETSVVAIVREKNEDDRTTAVRGVDPPAGLLPMVRLDDEAFVALPGDYGAGVAIGEDRILTAYHLLKGAGRIRVRAAKRQEFDAEIIGADPRSDLAVIAPKVAPNVPAPKLTPIPLGDASRLRKGAFLIALGNPYNAARDANPSAAWGILSNTARRILTPPEFQPGERAVQTPLRNQPTLLQLDAKLNLGMSGGAVVNLKGELVGITTTGGSPEAFDAQAGYAIPIDDLGRRVIDALREGKEVEYGLLGITLDTAGSNLVRDVRRGTPAEQADILTGDAIIQVGEREVTDRDELTLAISAVPVGTPVKIKVLRGDQEREMTITMAKFPPPVGAIITSRPSPWRGLRVDHASTFLTGFAQEPSTALPRGGVGIVEVEPGSPAANAGLKVGQVVTEIEGRPVRTPDEFQRLVEGKKGPVTLTTERGPRPHLKVTLK